MQTQILLFAVVVLGALVSCSSFAIIRHASKSTTKAQRTKMDEIEKRINRHWKRIIPLHTNSKSP